MIENNTEHSLTIGFLKSLVRQNFVRPDKIWNSVRPMSDKTLKYFDSTDFGSGNCRDHTKSWQEWLSVIEHSQFSFNRNWASKSLLQQYLRLLMYTNYMYEVKENFFLFQVHQVMSESCLFCQVYHEASYHEHWAKLTY